MLKSMTGFARASSANEAYEVVVEIRSVNHRYLDLRMRGTGPLVALEKEVRDRVSAELERGKVDVNVYLKPKRESAYAIEVDRPLMKELVRVAKEIREETGVSGELELSDLLAFSSAFQVKEKDLADGALVWQALESALTKALEELGRMRAAEGTEIAADLKARMDVLASHVGAIETLSEASRETHRAELRAKVDELLGAAVEPNVLAMEVSRLVERSDIAEEITRLRSHLELWRSAASGSGALGKKLDFIIQEMNREVNTIGSKCQDAAIAGLVIAMKSELERIREQIQNVE